MGKNKVNVNPDAARLELFVGPGFKLANIDPSSTPGFEGSNGDSKEIAEQIAKERTPELADLQERMYAQARAEKPNAPSVLVVLQGMDASGKGGIVRHVFGSVDPQGLQITSFKAPTEEEREHDFLWRIEPHAPKPGFIGVFDRSHYEDVLIQRVREFAPPAEIERRYGAIVEFEQRLVQSGTKVLKFMLHVSPEEQEKRLRERIERPDKHWKYNTGDLDERALWGEYAEAYQIALERTSVANAPWWVIPSDKKWYARLAIKAILLQAMRNMELEWPEVDLDQEAEEARLAESAKLLQESLERTQG
ncbi:PPK2 family polyphosphate kinase [Gulosibacter molinativorax]|uniref:PPK2 family polyphosphate--nucleotide phosphotransferase n=1 Tax=Gulosibacter molinativorax TaxID=256821 RepID=A0ABT7CAU2_9MICO|nr:PPK2 family polyphosphate kinase [Gulosibacter molinativorax]MDJ1372323.1 PPK2 family polyphosphate--nucleotide phosphotransferase [Gulosibacter molinativorax]QUY63417.1 Polyphosphate:nucleotide phosphotransferase, PPK2 family [Gulosibacter molinativorax]